jgi:quinoprotein dehydrogenase-associated probable ABC transporter substrate-binding protein
MTRRAWLIAVTAAHVAFAAAPQAGFAQNAEGGGLSIELIDPNVLRVCADPRNMPFSNEQGEGFENKLAELIAAKLNKRIAYTFYPGAPGFIRNTLGAYKCDVIMGYPQGAELVQSTNPYYRTTYALVLRRGQGLDGVTGLDDARLKGKHVGVVAGTPPSYLLAANGLMAGAKPYPLVVDTRFDNSAQAMMKDLVAGEIDAGVLWGPMAGYYAREAAVPVDVVPLSREAGGPRMSFAIAMAVRAADQEWKRQLNRLIQENQADIDKLLMSYGVPLLDDKDQPLGAPAK